MRSAAIHIAGQGKELKITWHFELPFPPYLVAKPPIENCSRKIRDVLRQLVGSALRGESGRQAQLLKALAFQGAALHKALFANVFGPGEGARVRKYLESVQTPIRIRCVVSDDIFVPWGLIYSGDPAALPDSGDAEPADGWSTYSKFWCFEHELSSIYDRILPDAAGSTTNAADLNILRVVDPQAYLNASKPLADSWERPFFHWLENVSGGAVTSEQELTDALKVHGAKLGLLYFYCHANATRLALGDEEHLEAADLSQLLLDVERDADISGCLIMMNGCSTAVGAREGEFIQATSGRGLCGFIGTEADVPDIFALRFSLYLLGLLLQEGMTLGAAMQQAYRAHFPLSLVYGFYALPEFRMPKSGGPPRETGACRNLSFDSVGTRSLGRCHVR